MTSTVNSFIDSISNLRWPTKEPLTIESPHAMCILFQDKIIMVLTCLSMWQPGKMHIHFVALAYVTFIIGIWRSLCITNKKCKSTGPNTYNKPGCLQCVRPPAFTQMVSHGCRPVGHMTWPGPQTKCNWFHIFEQFQFLAAQASKEPMDQEELTWRINVAYE